MKYSTYAILLASLLLIVGSTSRDLTEPDEARYVEVAREMKEQGRWLLPLYNYAPYSQKPPLFFWLLRMSGAAVSPRSTFRALIPVQVSAVAVLLLMLWVGGILGLERDGPVLIMALAGSLLFSTMSRIVRMDMLLVAWTLLGVGAILAFDRTLLQRYRLLVGVALAGGLYTKGPVILIWLAAAALGTVLARGRPRALKALFHPVPVVIGAVLFFAWLVPALIQGGPDYRRDLLFAQNVSRVVRSFAHREPIYYYLVTLPVALLPWTVLPIVGWFRVRRRPEAWILGTWIILPLLIFSLFSGKLIIYLLPALPAAALLAARAFDSPVIGRFVSGSALMFLLYGIAAWGRVGAEGVAADPLLWIIPLLGCAVALPLSGVRRPRAAFLALMAAHMLWFSLPVSAAAGRFMEGRDGKLLAEKLVQRYPDRARYHCYREIRPAYLTVTSRPFTILYDFKELRAHFEANPGGPVLIDERRLGRLPKRMREKMSIEAKTRIGPLDYCIVSAGPGSR